MNLLKYLTLSEEDKNIGINILNTGHNLIDPSAEYPYSAHPSAYKFQWERGRILNEFQINYIIDGEGEFESKHAGYHTISSGTIILLFPSEWHRYRPKKETGWNEYWIGYEGKFMHELMQKGWLDIHAPIMKVGPSEELFSLYQKLIMYAREEQPGSQMIMAGILIQILGLSRQLVKIKTLNGKLNLEQLIKKAKMLLMENHRDPLSPENVAQKLDIGYSRFRKAFKDYTGIAPGQYQMQQRIIKAKEMLLYDQHDIKEIAMEVGFDSNVHFTRIFKEKTGTTPGRFRRKALGKI
ncbi:MAG: helix-turn-helix domain-containing protein [Cyclobacteriaceae bacterium]